MKKYTKEDLDQVLASYGLPAVENFEMIDSSQGDDDVRHNYILDKKYVLRVNSAPVFTEQRLRELNLLIRRCNEFGLKAPYFLPDREGNYLHVIDGVYGYLSEYLDYPVAGQVKEGDERRPALLRERLALVAGFAQKYKGVGLTGTMSMYSLFELSPYDQLSGMDEKQENLGELAAALRLAGREALAERYERLNGGLREKLKAVHWKLPRCVFQGDENFSNVCLDETGHIVGLFDFNMAGTDVIANYLANVIFLGRVNYVDDPALFAAESAQALYDRVAASFAEGLALVREHYAFTQEEEMACRMYAGIVLISGWVFVSAYRRHLEKPETAGKAAALLSLLAEKLEKQFLQEK